MFDKYLNGKQINFQFIATSPLSSYGKECEGDFSQQNIEISLHVNYKTVEIHGNFKAL